MHSRFSLPVVVLALSLSVVVGTALMGVLGAAVLSTQASGLPTIGTFLSPVFTVLAWSVVAGAMGWAVLFLLRRDGFHRMESVAFLPFNYGGRNPFDTGQE